MILYKYVVKGTDDLDLCYYFPTVEELEEFSSFNYYHTHIVYIQIEKIDIRKLIKISSGWNKVRYEKKGNII